MKVSINGTEADIDMRPLIDTTGGPDIDGQKIYDATEKTRAT